MKPSSACPGAVDPGEPVPLNIVGGRVRDPGAGDGAGAGYSFAAAAIFGLRGGMPPSVRLNLAVACGALSTRAIGGTTAQATQQEAAAILAVEPS